MNDTNVPNPDILDYTQVLSALADELDQLSPQVRKAASHVLENPNDVSVSSIRELADAAGVKPNTLVRLARSIGFDGYENFREMFREEIRRGPVSFPDRARWLQSLGQRGKLGGLYRDMVDAAIGNIEDTFAGIDATQLQLAALTILKSEQVFTFRGGRQQLECSQFYLPGQYRNGSVSCDPKTGQHAG